jgi:subtilisin family serine protease
MKNCTSIAAALMALAAASTASAADRYKLPIFTGGAFSFGYMGSAEQLPSFSFALGGYRAVSSAHTPEIRSWTASDEYKASWFLDKIDAARAYVMGYTGKGILTAVVDSGIDTTHPEFAGRISLLSGSFVPESDPHDPSDVFPEASIT